MAQFRYSYECPECHAVVTRVRRYKKRDRLVRCAVCKQNMARRESDPPKSVDPETGPPPERLPSAAQRRLGGRAGIRIIGGRGAVIRNNVITGGDSGVVGQDTDLTVDGLVVTNAKTGMTLRNVDLDGKGISID
jgi:hypothetical protein